MIYSRSTFMLDYSVFFFSSRRRHTRYWRDWSSDVCSSDLGLITINLSTGAKIFWQNIVEPVEVLQYFSDGKRIAIGLRNSSFMILDLDKKSVRSEERRVGKECRSGWWTYN